ncbi:hypothetical protein OS493_005899 [Desmophyllum pertusum]|uniref:Uncharacterized protein n=1 Tax=Desmophyllum pertusum TaxID=174260 RepID=A0A9X0CGM7_9CNID|nr:hypothetical protein OS493_005899 [Desmophyllum pertusum]
MATAASGSSHLSVTENQKRWLVAGIALNKILIPQIRPFVEQGIKTEYNNLKTSHNIDGQSTSGRLQRWPPRKVLKYEKHQWKCCSSQAWWKIQLCFVLTVE